LDDLNKDIFNCETMLEEMKQDKTLEHWSILKLAGSVRVSEMM
jgi:hypothetical protein